MLVDRGGRELPIEADVRRRAPRGRARPVDRAVARRRTARSRWPSSAAGGEPPMRNPQLNADGELTHLLTLEGLPADVIIADPRHRGAVRVDRRARSEEGAAAARQGGVQPVLREFDAHAHDVRDRRQAAVGRRDQPQHRRVVDAARARRCSTPSTTWCAMNADMFVVRHSQSGAPHLIAAHLNRDRAHARPRRQRRRRPPRASDAGPARPLHDPPLQAGLPQADGRDRRRRAAFARRALADPRPHDARHAAKCA